MPTYIIEENGKRYEVTLPDAPQAAPVPTPQPGQNNAPGGPVEARAGGSDRAGGLGAFGAGMAQAAIKTALGLKSFAGLSEQDKQVLREIEAESKREKGAGAFLRGAGDIGANIAMLGVPGAKLEKALLATKAGMKLPATIAALVGGGTEFATSVGEGETAGERLVDKAKNAAVAGAISGGLQKTLGVLAQPFKPKAEAQRMFDQGINPTLQQGAEGAVPRFIGGLSAGSMDIKGRQEEEFAKALLKRVTEGNVEMPDSTGREFMLAGKNYVSDEYDKIFKGKRFPLSPKLVDKSMQAAQELNTRGQFAREAGMAGQSVANIFGETGDRVRMLNYDTFRNDYLQRLSKAAYEDAPNEEVKRRILEARKVLIDELRAKRLSPEERARLAKVDALNFDVERIREAVKGYAGEREGLDIRRVANAYAGKSMPGNTTLDELISPTMRVIGSTPRQHEARSLKTALTRASPLAAGTAAAALATGAPAVAALGGGLYGLSLMGQTPMGAQILFGQRGVQKKLADQLRKGVGLGPTGSIMFDSDTE